jgi:dipeptidyl aminopeptidase/acylaminoacyl peptidase
MADSRLHGAVLCCAMALVACTSSSSQTAVAHATPSPTASVSASPSPTYPPFYIESLRQLPRPAGQLVIGSRMGQGAGFARFHMTWPSQGKTMTGTIAIPNGAGPFPVVIVNHGYISVAAYTIGIDAWKYGDPMSSHGFISIAPDYPGYAGSESLSPPYPSIIGEALADVDLVSALSTLPQADTGRVAMMGHSNGGGVGLLVSVLDLRVKVFALFAPVSSDMAESARKFWKDASRYNDIPSPDAAPQAYAHVSPRNYFSATTAPTLLLQGTADEQIPADWTNATLAALHSHNVDSDLAWYQGARHVFAGSDLANANSRAEAWIRRHLP